jgi:hypothetical protein
MMYRWIAITFYILVSGLTKVIVGLFLTRVCTKQRWQRITLWTMIVVVSVYTLFYAILNINSCHPITWVYMRFGFDPPDPSQCNSSLLGTIPTYISGFMNVIVDWLLAILPATILWNLKLERRLKISTYIVLAIGSLYAFPLRVRTLGYTSVRTDFRNANSASIATIVRLPYASGFLASGDYMYRFTDLGIWSTVEIGSALSASSLATLKPLFRKINAFSSTNRTGGTSGANASYEMHKGRLSGPLVLSGRPKRDRMSVRLEDEESQFPSQGEHRVVISVTGKDRNSRYPESHAFGIHKAVTITHDG